METEPPMPSTEVREVVAARRLDNLRYAIRDLACLADEVARDGHPVLALNVGDPLSFDFQTPPALIEAVYQAMREGKNGYAPSPGIPLALRAIREEASRKGITSLQDVFVTSGVSETVDLCLTALLNPGDDILTPCPDYPLYSAVLAKRTEHLLPQRRGWLAARDRRPRRQDHAPHPRYCPDQSQQPDGIDVFAKTARTRCRACAAPPSDHSRGRDL
jgi:hypothetical protein